MLSRRSFTTLLGGAAASAALPFPILKATPQSTSIRLSANENPYGPPQSAIAAMREAFGLAARYPDDEAEALVKDIAASHVVAAGRVLLGNGSSEILKLAAAAYVNATHKLVVAEPTFEAIIGHARTAGGEIVRVPLTDKHAHDLPRMLEAAKSPSLVYVCNPNNPTATITPVASLKSFIAAVPSGTMVLVDEAYHHYAVGPDYESVIPLVAKYPNLIVARTFSKIYGMAGLRCGYCVAQEPVIAKLQSHQSWDSVNVMALVAARAALGDPRHVTESRNLNNATRESVREQIEGLGYAVLPSQANFVMIDTRREVRPVITALRERGVRVGRVFPAMPQHLRVTIGRPEEMRRFVSTFAEVLGGAPAPQGTPISSLPLSASARRYRS